MILREANRLQSANVFCDKFAVAAQINQRFVGFWPANNSHQMLVNMAAPTRPRTAWLG